MRGYIWAARDEARTECPLENVRSFRTSFVRRKGVGNGNVGYDLQYGISFARDTKDNDNYLAHDRVRRCVRSKRPMNALV
jgi:hypothetical protein